MGAFKNIDPLDFNHSPFRLIGRDWMLVAAEHDGKVNTMTASWGGMGVMWGRNVTYVVIRPQRYTKLFVDGADTLSLNFLDPEKYRKAQSYLGSVSGRDEDKIAKTGLTVSHAHATPFFTESRHVILCRKLFAQPYDPANFLDQSINKEWYPTSDHHTLYISEVLDILEA